MLYLIKRKLFELKIKNAIRKANAPVEFYGSLNGMRKSDVIKLAIKEHLKNKNRIDIDLNIYSASWDSKMQAYDYKSKACIIYLSYFVRQDSLMATAFEMPDNHHLIISIPVTLLHEYGSYKDGKNRKIIDDLTSDMELQFFRLLQDPNYTIEFIKGKTQIRIQRKDCKL